MKTRDGETLTGPAGSATQVHFEIESTDPLDWTATVGSWFLTCPGQSPAWSHYAISMIHLRPIEGVAPAVIRVPGSTHEVLLFACDPSKEPTTDPRTWSRLTPINLMEQVELPDDESAARVLKLCVQAVVDGVLWAEPPLSMQVEPWRTSLIRTAAHERGEVHAP